MDTFLLQNIIESLGKQQMVEFKCGDFLGPFAVRPDDEKTIRITLTNFTGEPMSLDIEPASAIRRIQCPSSPLFANCAVLQTGSIIQIMFTKDVLKNEALRALLVADMSWHFERKRNKKYECPKCHVAKFNSLQNLRVHEEMYCHEKKKTNEKLTPQILVPKGRVEVLKPVQGITIGSDEKKPQTPLDLSRASLSPTCSATSKSSSSEPFSPEKPFSCSCGVSFSNQSTFDAHRQFYCMHTSAASSSGSSAANRKVPEKCSKCEFVPVTASQLAMHIRTVHQTTKTFTCLVCGYRAFSMRGVRTHMRSHPTEEAQKFRVNDPSDDKV